MKNITALQHFLAENSLESLLLYMSKLKIKYTIRGNQSESNFECILFREGMPEYRGASGTSVKVAIAEALARFFANENKDYHEFMK